MAKARAKGRPIVPLELSAEERTYLERQVRRRRERQSPALRKLKATAAGLHGDGGRTSKALRSDTQSEPTRAIDEFCNTIPS